MWLVVAFEAKEDKYTFTITKGHIAYTKYKVHHDRLAESEYAFKLASKALRPFAFSLLQETMLLVPSRLSMSVALVALLLVSLASFDRPLFASFSSRPALPLLPFGQKL